MNAFILYWGDSTVLESFDQALFCYKILNGAFQNNGKSIQETQKWWKKGNKKKFDLPSRIDTDRPFTHNGQLS